MFLSPKQMKKIRSVLVVTAFILALAGAGAFYQAHFGPISAVASEITNWGLSFPTPGQPPIGNASSEQLEALSARYLFDL